MSKFWKIVLGIVVAPLLLAILADIISWVYDIAWIIPIILVLVLAFFIWRKSFLSKKMKIKRLVKAAIVDGKLSSTEKESILKNARKLGMSAGEAEIYVGEIVHQARKKKKRK